MSKIIRKLRLEKPHKQRSDKYKKGDTIIPSTDKMIRGIIKEMVHERGRVAPLSVIEGECEGEKMKILLCSVEGTFVGQKILLGENAPISIGNVLPLKNIPEGTEVCSVEFEKNDGGKIARSSGSYVTIIAHNKDSNITTLKLPSGVKKNVSSEGRAVIGVVAGGGVNEKPILKASVAHFKAKARGQKFPRVRGVAMNPVDHPHGGGNHQHIGHPSTISKHAPPNAKVGLVGARRTGLRRGSKKVLTK
ncbi:60S ribosomal L8 [Tubulinosema ratisbonensis]|uniref:60S ribosomal L8 n=1 Tax=Tubulinosema ratisbonensis TaxID=291195 RepID=A0A437ANV0_9MICR|nr:60S ribosomal L8 [Tubulinosema ratisbonensis]